MYKVIMQEKQIKYGKTGEEPTETWAETFVVQTGHAEVAAGALRSLANKLDPPKPAMRSSTDPNY